MFFEGWHTPSLFRALFLPVASALFAFGASPVLAGAEALPGTQPVFVPPALSFVPGGQSGTRTTTSQSVNVADAINNATVFCQKVPGAYRASCFADQLATIAQSLPAGEANNEIREVLSDASRKIERVVDENRDRSQPRISAKTSSANPVSTSQPLMAVTPEAEAETIAETAEILEEAGALLLRSASASQEHVEQYRQVADALDSSALLLRS